MHTFLALRLAFALLIICAASTCWGSPNGYLYTVDTITDAAPVIDPEAPGDWTLSFVSLVDDAPLETVELSFELPFYDALLTSLSIDPNGALHVSAEPPCCDPSCSYANSVCNVHTKHYNNLIAGNLRDLNPKDLGSVYYNDTGSSLKVFWDSVSRFKIDSAETGTLQTFMIEVFHTGEISFTYWSVSDPVEFGSGKSWLVGVRNQYGQGTDSVNIDDWETSQAGSYAVRTDIENDRRVSFFPVGATVCAGVTEMDLTRTDNWAVTFFEVYDVFAEGVQFWQALTCQYTLVDTFGDDVSAELSFTTQAASNFENEGFGWHGALYCEVPEVSAVGLLAIEYVEVTLVWRDTTLPLLDPFRITHNTTSTGSQESLYWWKSSCDNCLTTVKQFYDLEEVNDVCPLDCMGDMIGQAILDECGNCTLGASNMTYNQEQDCMGLCFGPFLEEAGTGDCLCDTEACVHIPLPAGGDVSDLSFQYVYAITETVAEPANYSLTTVPVDGETAGVDALTYVALRFKFPFPEAEDLELGPAQAFRSVNIDPQGAIHFIPPTDACYALGVEGILGENKDPYCVHSFIAIWLSELNSFGGSNIGYESTMEYFHVSFSNMSYASTPSSTFVSFSMTLFPNGTFELVYVDVPAPTTAVDLFSGVMQSAYQPSSDLAVNGTIAAFGLDENRTMEWFGDIAGPQRTYTAPPPKTSVVSDKTITYCPVAVSACLTPRLGSTAGGTTVQVLFNTFDTAESCLPDLLDSVQCDFDGVGTPLLYNASTGYFCVTPPGADNTAVTVSFSLLDEDSGLATEIPTNMLFFSYTANDTYLEEVTPSTDNPWYEVYCDDCGNFDPNTCVADCAGEWLGNAVTDDCGSCVEGTTGLPYNVDQDCSGQCFGIFDVDTTASLGDVCVCTGNLFTCVTNNTADYNYPPKKSKAVQYLLVNTSTAISDEALFGAQSTANKQGHRDRYTKHALQEISTEWSPAVFLSSYNDLAPVRLEFTFELYNLPIREVYIGKDGVIFLEVPHTSTCVTNVTHAFFDSSTDCVYPVIMPFLTDFDYDAGGSITYFASAESLRVRFEDVELAYDVSYAGSGLGTALFSFEVVLFAEGSIVVRYFQMTNPETVSGWISDEGSYLTRSWAVGISQNYDDDVNSAQQPVVVTSHSPVADSTFLFCRATTTLCVTPTLIPKNRPPSAPALRAVVTGTGISLIQDCFGTDVACKFGETEVEVDIDEDSGDYVCVIPERPSEFTNRDLTLSFQLIRLDTGEPLHENDLFIFYSNNVNDTLIQPILLQTCEDCGQFRAECTKDCSGVWNGPADIDDCGDCYGGDTGKVAGSNKDCHGICGGPFADDWPEYLDISHPDLDLKGCGCQITGEHCDLYQTAPGSVSVLETWKLLDDVQLTFLLMATISSVCIVVTAAIVAFRRARHPRIFVSNDDPVVVEEHDPNEGLASDEE